MTAFQKVNTALVSSYINEQQTILSLQQKLLSYNKMLERATIVLVFISDIKGFSPVIIMQLRKAIVTRADRQVFFQLFEKIRQGLVSHPEDFF